MNHEIPARSGSGYLLLVVLLVLQVGSVAGVIFLPPLLKVLLALAAVVVFICWFGFYMVHPNQGKVLQLFGRYAGTDRLNGLRWANPLYSKKTVSLRVRNIESGRLKVNDANGNPIEIAAVIVWRVVDTAEAVFRVNNYENYVTLQSDDALPNLATSYLYEHDKDDERLSLRSDSNAISLKLPGEVQDRLQEA